MTIKRNLLWLAIVTALPVSNLYAQDDFGFDDEEPAPVETTNHVEIGVGTVSDDNGKLGEFADELDKDGIFAIGSIHLQGGTDTYSSYLDIIKNPYNSSLAIGYVRPGNIKAEVFGYDSQKIEKYNVETPYAGLAGSSDLPSLDDLAATVPGRHTYLVERDTHGIAITKYLSTAWSLSADYSKQKKDGTKTLGNHTNDAILPFPVDYELEKFSFGGQYKGEKLTVGASYYVSEFTNDNHEVRLFDGGELDGELAQEPSNEFSRFEIDGLYQLGDRTMLNWIANWSKAEQNEAIVGVDANLIPGTTFDGEVERFNGRLTLTGRPTRTFNYRVEYAVRDREANHDPIDLAYRRDSKIFDKDQDTLKAEGGYRFGNNSKLSFGYKRDNIDRTAVATEAYGGIYATSVSETEEDTFWANFKFAPMGKLHLSIKAESSERDGNQGQFPEWISVYDADRDREKYSLNASYMLSDFASISSQISRVEDDYDVGDYVNIEGNSVRDPYGMKSRDWYSAYFDFTLAPSEDVTVSLFVMNTTFDWERFGWEVHGGTHFFDYNSEDESDAWGLNLNMQISTKLHLSADLITTDSGSTLSSIHEEGDTYTRLVGEEDNARLNVVATYQVDDSLSAYARYIYEDWDINDPLSDGTYHDARGYGWDANDGNNHGFIIGVRKSF